MDSHTLYYIVVTASTDDGTLNAVSHTFTENGPFTFTATDAAGNTTSKTVNVTNINKNCVINFDSQEGSAINSINAIYGSKLIAPKAPSKITVWGCKNRSLVLFPYCTINITKRALQIKAQLV